MVAQSDRCLCAEVPGALPVLYFPLADIDFDGSEGLAGCVLPAEPLRGRWPATQVSIRTVSGLRSATRSREMPPVT